MSNGGAQPASHSISHGLTPFSTALVSGALAGLVVDLSLYPLDTLKTRLQSAQGFKASGGFRGVYSGVTSAIVGSAPGAALFFVSYEQIKSTFSRYDKIPTASANDVEFKAGTVPASVVHMLAASVGEVAACAVRVPTEVIKQRAQALRNQGSWSVLQQILQQRRTSGLGSLWMQLYRGWSITIMREVPFTVIQFPLWEAMKGYYRRGSTDCSVSAVHSAVFGSLAGAIAAAFTTPLDVLKTRIMLAKRKQNIAHHARKILRDQGAKGFFAGITPRIIWISAGGGIFLGSYQWASNALAASVQEGTDQ